MATGQSDESSRTEGQDIHNLVQSVVTAGQKIHLPFIAASADIGDPSPMCGPDGKPYAGDVFKWFDPDLDYWNDRTFALRSGFIQAARICSEPMYYDGTTLKSWRQIEALEVFNQNAEYETFGVKAAIVCPCHMPFGVLGVIVWATNEHLPDIADIFDQNAASLHILTLKLLSSYRDNATVTTPTETRDLTRREIQCLRWAALGKTDNEIGTIMGVSVPTVRFHLVNAGKKFGVHGRAQAVRVATSLGYIGGRKSA